MLAFGALAVVGAASGLSTIYSVSTTKQSVEHMRELTGVLRRQTLSDMHHDGIRAIVYVALHDGGRKAADSSDTVKELEKTITQLDAGIQGIPDTELGPAVSAAKPELLRLTGAYVRKARELVDLAFSNPAEAESRLGSFATVFEDLAVAMDKMGDLIEDANKEAEENAARRQNVLQWQTSVASAIIMLALAGVFFWLRFALINGVSALARSLVDRDGEVILARVADRNAGNELGELAAAMRIFRANGVDAARVRAALDTCPINVLAADNDGRIVYANPAVLQLMRDHLPEFRLLSPGFDPDAVIGSRLDGFHRDPSRVNGMVTQLRGSHRSRIRAGSRTFDIVVSPIVKPDGERLGAMLIWEDMTAIVAADQELAELASAAAEGDFSKRIQLADKQGFAKDMSSGLNALSTRVEEAVQEFASVLGAVANGDLTALVRRDYRGGLGALSESINRTVDRLAETVSEIQRMSTEVAEASREISSGAVDLSQRTETQAHSLEQTAATVDELALSVRASAEASGHAAEMAEQARSVAREGGVIVADAVEAMERIDQTSRRISEITSVIDDIAFQTNLLALNAAVEAARAGEAGKGFAVVASEVRTLAQRSSGAAKDITNLIATSNAEVTNGVRLVRAAGDTLGRIVDASATVASSVAEISAAARDQASGIQAITRSVAQLDEMTQQNAALAEESAASSGQLSTEMQRLRGLAEAFNTGEKKPARVSAAASAKPTPPAKASRQSAPASKLGARAAAPAPKLAKAVGGSWDEF
ncbi:methyl-accepting chemotaxis protein [Alsobacter metallidurans]|nr:methyl-accepting chemotaxis protein [Alsobacter metallidurans]